MGTVALALLGAKSSHVVRSSSDRVDVKQLVDKTRLASLLGFAQETMGRVCISPVGHHEVNQSALLVDSPEQVLPLAANLHAGLVHTL